MMFLAPTRTEVPSSFNSLKWSVCELLPENWAARLCWLLSSLQSVQAAGTCCSPAQSSPALGAGPKIEQGQGQQDRPPPHPHITLPVSHRSHSSLLGFWVRNLS